MNKQQKLKYHIRGLEKLISPYIVPKGTYKLLNELKELKIEDNEQK